MVLDLELRLVFYLIRIPKVYTNKFRKIESVQISGKNLIIVDKDFVKLNQNGFLFADAIAIDLMI